MKTKTDTTDKEKKSTEQATTKTTKRTLHKDQYQQNLNSLILIYFNLKNLKENIISTKMV